MELQRDEIARASILESLAAYSNTEVLSIADVDVAKGCISTAEERIRILARQVAALEEEQIQDLSIADIDESKDCISTDEERIGIFARQIAAHEEQIQREKDDLIIFHRAIAPHERLPREIIAEIFLQTLSHHFIVPPIMNSPPWTLRAVSSFWRSIALAERRLWNHVEVKSAGTSESSLTALARYQFLNQSIIPSEGLLSLKGDINVHDNSCSIFFKEVVCPNLLRLHTLDIDVLSYDLYDSGIAPNSCPELVSLSLDIFINFSHSAMPYPCDFPFFTGMAALRELHLFGIAAYPKHIPWEQLTSLSIDLDVSSAAAMLSRCSNLLSCKFVIVQDYEFRTRVPRLRPVQVPQLRCFTLPKPQEGKPAHAWALLKSLTLPALSELNISSSAKDTRQYCKAIKRLILRSGCALNVLYINKAL
ncbi:hypothetical protein DXG03_002323 [Asterophora parasitica]|uniref:F-box domain-containing protein n=1 Tax=Asterophora parasitica TaxID=117018 RepID=A0A9P7G4J3_9AGAR|nr:hypothetical protein DXG03_002323 [Asterophora parasitica]